MKRAKNDLKHLFDLYFGGRRVYERYCSPPPGGDLGTTLRSFHVIHVFYLLLNQIKSEVFLTLQQVLILQFVKKKHVNESVKHLKPVLLTSF